MITTSLLVVEDDAGIQEMLDFSLSPDGYQLSQAMNAKQGWEMLQSQQFDLVLLDWMLPDGSGIDLLHRIRKYRPESPVIMVTAKTAEEDRVQGLDVGADDYITKPFSVRELKSRINAVLRRTRPEQEAIQIGELMLDVASHRVNVGDTEVNLAPIEFRLLHFFMSHLDRVYSRSQLLDQVWGDQVYVEERTVDVHVRRLRKRLEPFGLSGMLQTVHGSGYRFSREA